MMEDKKIGTLKGLNGSQVHEAMFHKPPYEPPLGDRFMLKSVRPPKEVILLPKRIAYHTMRVFGRNLGPIQAVVAPGGRLVARQVPAPTLPLSLYRRIAVGHYERRIKG